MRSYYYEKHYNRSDGQTLVRSYSRSFSYGEDFNPITGEIKEKELIIDFEQLKLDFDPEDIDSEKEKNNNSLVSSMSRARNKVKILAFSNPDLVGMLTLTNRDCPTEEVARKRFENFRNKIKTAGYTNFKFLGVKELQKRGSIHWHILVNFCPGDAPSPNNPKKRISSLWSYGYSDYQLISGDDRWRTELYLLKYMTKGHLKLFNQYYVRSRNLDLIEPDLLSVNTTIPPSATNLFESIISNAFVDNFRVVDYTVPTINLTRRKSACSRESQK